MAIRGYFAASPLIAPQPVSFLPGTGFVVCPLMWQDTIHGGCGIAMIYRLAYERTQAALGPSRYERLCWVSPN